MNKLKRRATYQFGTLTQETRRRGPDVWVYRHFEVVNGSKRRRKTVVGTLEQYPTRAAAERACEHVRLVANAENLNPQSPTMRGLIDRYIEQVLRPCINVPIGEAQDSFCSNLIPLRQVVQVRPRQVGAPSLGEL